MNSIGLTWVSSLVRMTLTPEVVCLKSGPVSQVCLAEPNQYTGWDKHSASLETSSSFRYLLLFMLYTTTVHFITLKWIDLFKSTLHTCMIWTMQQLGLEHLRGKEITSQICWYGFCQCSFQLHASSIKVLKQICHVVFNYHLFKYKGFILLYSK